MDVIAHLRSKMRENPVIVNINVQKTADNVSSSECAVFASARKSSSNHT